LQRLITNPLDYGLSVMQWQYGFAANQLTVPRDDELLPDEQPADEPLPSLPWAGLWLQALRACQYQIGVLRGQLLAARRPRRPAIGGGALPREAWAVVWPASYGPGSGPLPGEGAGQKGILGSQRQNTGNTY
jgi:hypothetical protein